MIVSPTSDDCNERRRVTVPLPDGRTIEGYACWYPQMGGYVGRAVVVPAGGCFHAYVWHDGDFPFCPSEKPPVEIHHCDADQFIEFGNFVNSLLPDTEGTDE